MNKFFFIVLSVLITAHISYAEELIQDRFTLNKTKEKEICIAIKESIKDGFKTKDIVKTSIKLGHSVCLVVKCAIEGGGDVKEVVIGTIEAGGTPDVVARCAVDAGADPREVGGYIMIAGLLDECYFEPERLEEAEIENLQGEDSAGGFLSPSTP